MKKIILVLCGLQFVGCASLDSSGQCYYAEVSKQYLIDEKGYFINEKGIRVSQPVVNPEYQNHLKCNQSQKGAKSVSSLGSIKDLLKDAYVINGIDYQLMGQRKTRPEGGYIQSLFLSSNNKSGLQQEIFTYMSPDSFRDRFLLDINRKEGGFKAQTVDGIEYIIGRNNHNLYVIYIVKKVLNREISIVQLTAKEPFNEKDIAQLVKDLNKV